MQSRKSQQSSLHSLKTAFLLSIPSSYLSTILNKIFGTKWRNQTKLGKSSKLRYLILCDFWPLLQTLYVWKGAWELGSVILVFGIFPIPFTKILSLKSFGISSCHSCTMFFTLDESTILLVVNVSKMLQSSKILCSGLSENFLYSSLHFHWFKFLKIVLFWLKRESSIRKTSPTKVESFPIAFFDLNQT